MVIWHISDTHGNHDQLLPPPAENVDIVVHSGDFTSYHDLLRNRVEAFKFIEWYSKLPYLYKILVAGNHDAFAYLQPNEFKQLCMDNQIIYL